MQPPRGLSVVPLTLSLLALASVIVLLVAFVAVVAVPGGDEEKAVNLSPEEILSASAQRSSESETLRGDFEATLMSEEFEFESTGEFAFQAPDSIYLTVALSGSEVHTLAVASGTYVQFPDEGERWYVVDSESLSVDWASLQSYRTRRGLIDYPRLTELLDGPDRLPDTELEGHEVLHLDGTLEPGEMADELPSQFFPFLITEGSKDSFRRPRVELWLDKETFLPRRVEIRSQFPLEELTITLQLALVFTDYDEPAPLPTPPADPKPLEEPLVGQGGILGLRCSYASKFLREKYLLPPGRGCVVLRVDANSGAERGGLRIGDRIIALDGIPITSGYQFTLYFEHRQGSPHRTFTIQRQDRELTIDVVLGNRADPPEVDPYFYYLRAKSDTNLENYGRVIQDYTRAIELEPRFDLAYLYRGADQMGRDDVAAKADLLMALELDPGLTEAHRNLAYLLALERDYEGALAHMDRSIELNGCSSPAQDWDLDCGGDFYDRAWFRSTRLDPGDDRLVEADMEAAANVTFLEPGVALQRLELAYLRGDDSATREQGEAFLATPQSPVFPKQGIARAVARHMIDNETFVLEYWVGDWVEWTDLASPTPSHPGAATWYERHFTGDEETPASPALLVYQVSLQGLNGGETISWELVRGPYRLGSNEMSNRFEDTFRIQLGAPRHLPPGTYELRVWVDGQEKESMFLDVP